MSGGDSTDFSWLVDRLARDFIRRLNAGEDPSFDEYVRDHPHLSESFHQRLRELQVSDPTGTGHGTSSAPTLPMPAGPGGADGFPALPDYDPIRQIGRGGMGEVWLVRDPRLRRDLAVKIAAGRHRGNSRFAARFVEEAHITGQLQHPGIVPVHGLGELADGRPYFAMKVVKGRTLSELLEQAEPGVGGVTRFLPVFAQVCQAVAYAHSRGVIHRDLKPSNVMVGAFGEVQVMDWGIAKVLGDGAELEAADAPGTHIDPGREEGRDTRSGAVMGTYAYMAPEQARGLIGETDRRGDVFSLGAILCEILTGQPAYRGRRLEVQAAQAELADAAERLDACGADPELVSLAKQCLAERKADRPADAGEVADVLDRYQAELRDRLERERIDRETEKVREAEEHKRLQLAVAEERRRRKLTMLLAGAVVLTLAIAGFAIGWWYFQRSALEADVGRLLTSAEGAAEVGDMDGAKEALDRANGRLGNAGPGELRARADGLGRALEIAKLLRETRRERAGWIAAVRVSGGEGFEGGYNYSWAVREYRRLFGELGLDVESAAADELAEAVRRSPITSSLVDGLDDWALSAFRTGDRPLCRRLLGLARAADRDAEPRDRLRDLDVWEDADRLQGLIDEAAGSDDLPISLAIAVSSVLRKQGGSPRDLLESLNRRDPGDYWVNFELGIVALEQNRPAESLAYFRAALAAVPDKSPPHTGIGLAWLYLDEPAKAEEALLTAMALNPDYPPTMVNLANARYRMGRVEEALGLFRQATERFPDSVWAHHAFGSALLEMGRQSKAIPVLERALEIDDSMFVAHNNLGIALYRTGSLDEAEGHLRRAVELDPSNPAPHGNLGNVLRGSDPAAARREYETAIALKPDLAEAHSGLGVILFNAGEFAAAEAPFRRAIAIAPHLTEPHRNLAGTLAEPVKYGEWEKLLEAVAHARTAVTLDSRDPANHLVLADCLKRSHRYPEAVRVYRDMLELPAGDHAEVRKQLAEVEGQSPYFRKGLVRLSDNGTLPEEPVRAIGMAELAYSNGDFAIAEKVYAHLFHIAPGFAEGPDRGPRFRAACAAAWAAKRDPDGPHTRAALDWLRAEFEAWDRLFETAGRPVAPIVRSALLAWKRSPDLASLREPGRPEVDHLWAEVDGLLAVLDALSPR